MFFFGLDSVFSCFFLVGRGKGELFVDCCRYGPEISYFSALFGGKEVKDLLLNSEVQGCQAF